MKKIISNKKVIIFGGILLILFLFAVPQFAGAQFGFLNPVNLVTWAARTIAGILNFFLGYVFMLAGWFVDVATQMNRGILADSNALVKVGWTISRDIANLGFVLIMIVISVATIVRYKKYAVQKLLPTLIGAAILVNFSLTIAGVLIKFSDTLATTFTSRLTTSNLTDAIAGAFDPQRLLLKDNENPPPPDPSNQGGAFTDFSATILISLSGSIFSVIFLAIAAFSMFTLAIMLLYRYIYLSVLLVLAPLAWLFWVFPDLQHLFGKWWKNFLKWTFFFPAMTFFLFLAVKAAEALKTSGIFIQGSIFSASGFADVMSQGVQMIVLTGLLFGGLLAAQEMSIEGAGGAIKLATKAKDGALKYNKGLAGRAVTRVTGLRTETGKKVTDWMQTAGQNNPLGRIVAAPLRYAGRGFAKARMDQEKKAADEAKKLPKNLDEQARQYATSSTPRRVAILNGLTKERKNRKKKKDGADKKRDAAQDKASNIEKDLKEEMGKNGNTKRAKELRNDLAGANAMLEKAETEAKDARKSMGEINRVINTLPKNTQKDLEASKYEMNEIEIAKRYGHRKDNVEPTKGKTEKVEAAIKAIAEEEKEEEKKEKKEVEKEEKTS